MFSFKGIGFRAFAAIMALIALGVGIYLTFFESAGFERTEATIVSIVPDPDSTAENDAYIVTVTFTVEGQTYTGRLDAYSPTYKEGKTVSIRYDPQNPAIFHGGEGFAIYLMVVGAAMLVILVVTGVQKKGALQELKEKQSLTGGATYAPSQPGEEREVYFVTDTGTPKYGHRIEDKDRRVLYEAKMTKFTLLNPYGFDFIDHEHGTTTPHLVGHEESTENNSLLLDNHYTFDLDGEDIWKHLKRNGISVETERREGTVWPRYRVFRDGAEIALLESSSRWVHEEDAAQHQVMDKLAFPGYFRIWTREERLDVVFVVALAFARSGALNDEGGTFGKQLRKKR